MCHIFSVRALGRLVVLVLEEECKHLQTQRSLTILYLRSSSSRLFCQKLKAANFRQPCCHLICVSVNLYVCVCVCMRKGRQPVGTDVGKVSKNSI